MMASGRTEVASDVKFCVGAFSWSSTSGPNFVIVAQTVFKRSRFHDGDDDDDGVRGLSHKRLRQLRLVRALKMSAVH